MEGFDKKGSFYKKGLKKGSDPVLPAAADENGSGPVLSNQKTGMGTVFFLGATNVPWQLDPAVLRPGRFDEKVHIPLPDLPARRRMLELYLANRPLAGDVDFDDLSTRLAGYSGADIKYVCDRAATIPFLQSVASGEEGEITAAVLETVLADARPSVSREALARFEQWRAAADRA
jgi:transitional endoplasmic reticulum ATPase